MTDILRNELPAPATRNGPPVVNCTACGLTLLAGWRFRRDDKYCGLCGKTVLNLVVSHTDPSGTVWLYCQPEQPIIVAATWLFGHQQPRPRSLPEIDFSRSRASFR